MRVKAKTVDFVDKLGEIIGPSKNKSFENKRIANYKLEKMIIAAIKFFFAMQQNLR